MACRRNIGYGDSEVTQSSVCNGKRAPPEILTALKFRLRNPMKRFLLQIVFDKERKREVQREERGNECINFPRSKPILIVLLSFKK